mmetsp:Transcript_15631/g.27707  ORF Transcript_15631/g.27707 Transcript_15631/m.27707 type:complete len:436 (-) Transcript_15631:133-1440(-)
MAPVCVLSRAPALVARSSTFSAKGCFSRSTRALCAPFTSVRLLKSRAAYSLSGSTTRLLAASASSTATVTKEDVIIDHPSNNVTENIFGKLDMNLHQRPNHPLGIIKFAIENYFEKEFPGKFNKFDSLYPVVSTKANFDDVLIPSDHVSRSPNDTYYIDDETVLRCHTSAHQAELLRKGETHFLVTGDVYRRDSIDATHYPVFHQMEGVCLFSAEEAAAAGCTQAELAEKELKRVLEGLAKTLFGEVEMRWYDTYFPFTEPSFELEIFFKGEWLEVLGCGVMQQAILDDAGRNEYKAWAFGLGLERLAMVLFDIPDIRLFWTDDERFSKQFKAGDLATKFKSYSKFPPCNKDVSFWISDKFSENNLCEITRNVAGDLVEEVKLIDEFTNEKKGKTSHCYRIVYRSNERSLTDEEINALQEEVRSLVVSKLEVELR